MNSRRMQKDFDLATTQANVLAGLVSFLQNPLLELVLRDMDGHFLLPLLAQLGLVRAVTGLFKLLTLCTG